MELKNNINRVKSMLKKYKEVKYYDYQEIEYVMEDECSLFLDDSFEESFMLGLDGVNDLINESEHYDNGKKLVLRKEFELENKKVGE